MQLVPVGRRTFVLGLGSMLLLGQLARPARTNAQGLPGGPSEGGLPLPDRPAQSASAFGTGQLPQPSYARAMAERVVAGLDTLGGNILRTSEELARARQRLADAQARKARIEAERDRVLDDYRRGYFCSTCGRAMSEFGSKGEFWAHIAEGAPQGRHAVPATARQTAQKEAEFTAKLAEALRDIRSSSADIQAKEQESQDGLDQMREGIALWKYACEMEPELLRANLAAAQGKDERDLNAARQQIAQLEARRKAAVGSGDRDAVARIDEAIATWRQVAQRIDDAGTLRYDQFLRASTQAAETANKEYAAISGIVARIYGSNPYLPNLPNFSLTLGNVTMFGGGATVGAKFRFGKILQVGVSTGAPDAVTAETRGFIELMGRAKIYGGYQNQFTPSGPRERTVFGLDLTPPKGEVAPKPAPDKTEGRDPQRPLPPP
jgi:hypothetical protein